MNNFSCILHLLRKKISVTNHAATSNSSVKLHIYKSGTSSGRESSSVCDSDIRTPSRQFLYKTTSNESPSNTSRTPENISKPFTLQTLNYPLLLNLIQFLEINRQTDGISKFGKNEQCGVTL